MRRAAQRLRLSWSSSTGTNRATGRPWRVMVRDSPLATLSRRRGRWILASYAPTVSILGPPSKLVYLTSLLTDLRGNHIETDDSVLASGRNYSRAIPVRRCRAPSSPAKPTDSKRDTRYRTAVRRLWSNAQGRLRDSPAALGAGLVNLPNAIPMQTRDRLARECVAVVCRPCTLLARTFDLPEDRAGLTPISPLNRRNGRQAPSTIALVTPSGMFPGHSRLARC